MYQPLTEWHIPDTIQLEIESSERVRKSEYSLAQSKTAAIRQVGNLQAESGLIILTFVLDSHAALC